MPHSRAVRHPSLPGYADFLGFLALTILIGSINFAVCGYWLRDFSFLNDDAALLNGAVFGVPESGVLRPFYTPQGPNVIRPFQVLGMYLEGSIFGFAALPMHIVSLAWLTLGEVVLVVALLRWAGWVGALTSVVLISFSMGSAESRYWLSDRHDLYLLFFFACILLLADRWMSSSAVQKRMPLLALTIAAQWGCFLSNEKGAAVPTMVSGFVFLSLLAQPREHSAERTRRAIGFALCSVINTVLYLGYRFLIVGQMIGGYTDSLLPSTGIHLHELRLFFTTLVTSLYRQATPSKSVVASCLGWGIVALLLIRVSSSADRKSKQVIIGLLLALGIVVLSAVPTLQFSFLGVAHGTLNSRMQWLPSVVIAIFTGWLVGHGVQSARSTNERRIRGLCGLLLCLIVLPGGLTAAKRFAQASRLNDEATQLLQQYCSCVTFDGRRFRGLPVTFAGFNAFTETTWIEFNAKVKGTPGCSLTAPAQEICSIEFAMTESRIDAIPHQISQSRIAEFMAATKWRLPESDYPVANPADSGCIVDSFLVPAKSVIGEPALQIHGWCRNKIGEAAHAIIVEAGGKVIAVTPPNRHRSDVIAALGGDRNLRLGFHLVLSGSNGTNPKDVRLFALYRDQTLDDDFRTFKLAP